ncbi:MAG: TerB family tellurite resistance protein [Myxococcota bacterium]
MDGLRFENLEKLVTEVERDGDVLRCTFVCPVSETEFASSAVLVKGEGLSDVTGEALSLGNALRDGLSRAVTSAFGTSFLLKRNRDGARKGAANFSQDEQKLGIFRSFQGVSSRFVWHGVERRWISAVARPELATEFSLQLCRAPVENGYDESVTARMLAEVAAADGKLADEERDLLERFVNSDIGTVDDLLDRSALRTPELQEVSVGPVRETMLMMVWALAVIDERLHDSELAILARFARGLEIPPERSDALRGYAAEFAVDRALELAYPAGEKDGLQYASARSLATKLGVTRSEAERMDIRVRKRLGAY